MIEIRSEMIEGNLKGFVLHMSRGEKSAHCSMVAGDWMDDGEKVQEYIGALLKQICNNLYPEIKDYLYKLKKDRSELVEKIQLLDEIIESHTVIN